MTALPTPDQQPAELNVAAPDRFLTDTFPVSSAWGIHRVAVIVVFGVLGRRKVLLTWDDADCLDLQDPGKGAPSR